MAAAESESLPESLNGRLPKSRCFLSHCQSRFSFGTGMVLVEMRRSILGGVSFRVSGRSPAVGSSVDHFLALRRLRDVHYPPLRCVRRL
jgi:hypothetical protein